LLSERVDLCGVVATIVDSAGIRESSDPVEREGVVRTGRARGTADLTLLVLDATEGMTADDVKIAEEAKAEERCLHVWNKCDLVTPSHQDLGDAVLVSARTGAGVDALRRRVVQELTGSEPKSDLPSVANIRHVEVLRRVDATLGRVERLASRPAPEEILLRELHTARGLLDELVGARTAEDVLTRVFERFCIGK
jgi:tRNA modification GTPase